MTRATTIWNSLIADATTMGVYVHAVYLHAASANHFEAPDTIRIRVPFDSNDEPVIDDEEHAPDLAHELGHVEASSNGTEHPIYAGLDHSDTSKWLSLPLSTWEIICDEESKAWDRARVRLTQLGFAAWAKFDQRRADAMKSYEDVRDAKRAAGTP